MRKIAVYGKGGIGKSTTTSNISAAVAAHKGCYFHIHSFVSFKTSDPLIERGKTGCPRTDFIGIEAI